MINVNIISVIMNDGTSNDPNIALGDELLTTDVDVRAYWDFTKLTGNEGEPTGNVSDLRGNNWTLSNFSGATTSLVGEIQIGTRLIKCLHSYTASGYEYGLVGTTASTNLLKGSVEVHMLINLVDGRETTNQYVFGCSNGGTQIFRVGITPAGKISLEYAASGAGLSTILSDQTPIPNGMTGIIMISLILDLDTTDTLKGYVNGVPITFTVSSGNALSIWNPSNWVCTKGVGIAGHWDGVFTNDTGVKYCLKAAVTNLLTQDKRLYLMASFLNI